MINKMRTFFAALTILLASATALVAIPDLAAARGGGHDHKDHKVHKDHGDRHSDRARSHHRRKHKKHKVVCIKAPCPGDGGEGHGKHRHKHAGDENKDKAGTSTANRDGSANGHDKGCGKVIVPTAGCATPSRDPVGNTRPSLPEKSKQPTDASRKPVLENIKQPASRSANQPAKPVTVSGKLPNDPVGNTHPTPGPNPPTAVTVSNGVTTTQIQNGLGGVSVYSGKPGTITVTNGKESTTLSGASVTLSGNVVGVGGGQGVQVGPRNGEGKRVVAIKPPAPAPAPSHVTGGPEGGFFGALGSSIKDGAKAVGNGLEHGAIAAGKGIAVGLGIDPKFKAGPAKIVPPPATSTIQQQ